MLGTQNLSLFLVSCILLNLTPGQDTMFILGRSIAQGRKAGLISAMGIMSGVLIHTSLTALGLSAILATSALAFSIVKFAGAGYLIWIGIDFLRSREHNDKVEDVEREQLGTLTIYRQGVLTNILNPKVSLFFLSFLPQFVDPQAEFIFSPFIVLGLIFFSTGSIWCTILVCGSTWLTDKVRNRTSVGGILKKLTGILFVGLGIKLAFSHAQQIH
jgi:threonine/homoserine/homoserine lactone efflux protein